MAVSIYDGSNDARDGTPVPANPDMLAQARAEHLAAGPVRLVETGDTAAESETHPPHGTRAMTRRRLPIPEWQIPINGLTEHALKIHGAPPAFLEGLTTKELVRVHGEQHPGGGGHYPVTSERIDRTGGKR